MVNDLIEALQDALAYERGKDTSLKISYSPLLTGAFPEVTNEVSKIEE